MPDLIARLGLRVPILQAGMGGGLAGHELAAAVSEAGGLGTLGMLDPEPLRDQLKRTRSLTANPIAVNLLLPFTREAHWRIAREADAVITFWGTPVRRTSTIWIHQCGSPAEARQAHEAGADAVIAQGVEAGGHVRGTTPALELLAEISRELPGYPVLLAGGIADARDVRRALDGGASAVVVGTRFLLSEESNAHPEYKRRLLAADRTLLTELFGLGWPAPHRVVANAATDRWLRGDPRGPAIARLANRGLAPLTARMPLAIAGRLMAAQRTALPLFGPSPATRGAALSTLEVTPLYAGESVARISDIRSAGDLVRALASG